MAQQRKEAPRVPLASFIITLLVLTACIPGRTGQSGNPQSQPPDNPLQGKQAGTPVQAPGGGIAPAVPTTATPPITATPTKLGKFVLTIAWQGTYAQGAYVTAQYGPDTAVISVDTNGSGSFIGEFRGRLTGQCTAAMVYPVSFEAAVSPHGSDEVAVSVTSAVNKPATVGSCQNLSGPPHVQGVQVPARAFTLPSDGGAMSFTDGPITWTYTLTKQGN